MPKRYPANQCRYFSAKNIIYLSELLLEGEEKDKLIKDWFHLGEQHLYKSICFLHIIVCL